MSINKINLSTLKLIIILLFVLINSFILTEDLSANELNLLFRQANNFLQQGNYYDAIKIYQELEKQSNDPNLHYNIGNCYAQIDEAGYAVLYYKRALRIDSSNSAVRKALEQMESSIISANLAESSFTNRLLFSVYNWLDINRLALIVFMLFLSLGILIYLYLSQKIAISIFAKRFYLTLNIFLLLLFIAVSISKFTAFVTNREVIVVKKNTIIHKDEDGRIFPTNKKLQAGLSLKYLSSLEDRKAGYSLVALPNGEIIAIENESFRRVVSDTNNSN